MFNWLKKKSSVEVISLEAQIIKLQEHDVLVLTTDKSLSDEQFQRIKNIWDDLIREHPIEKCRAIILDGGIELKVLHKPQI